MIYSPDGRGLICESCESQSQKNQANQLKEPEFVVGLALCAGLVALFAWARRRAPTAAMGFAFGLLCGVPPYSPVDLVDLSIQGDRVSIRFAEPFGRPVRLTLPEAIASPEIGFLI